MCKNVPFPRRPVAAVPPQTERREIRVPIDKFSHLQVRHGVGTVFVRQAHNNVVKFTRQLGAEIDTAAAVNPSIYPPTYALAARACNCATKVRSGSATRDGVLKRKRAPLSNILGKIRSHTSLCGALNFLLPHHLSFPTS